MKITRIKTHFRHLNLFKISFEFTSCGTLTAKVQIRKYFDLTQIYQLFKDLSIFKTAYNEINFPI